MPHKIRPLNVFETRSIKDYFDSSHLAKIRYSCVRAEELDNRLGGSKNSAYLLACAELADAIRLSVGLSPYPTALKEEEEEVEEELEEAEVEEEVEATERADLIEEIGFPPTSQELSLSMSKSGIIDILKDTDNSDISEDLGITEGSYSLKKKDLIKFIYTGA